MYDPRQYYACQRENALGSNDRSKTYNVNMFIRQTRTHPYTVDRQTQCSKLGEEVLMYALKIFRKTNRHNIFSLTQCVSALKFWHLLKGIFETVTIELTLFQFSSTPHTVIISRVFLHLQGSVAPIT